MRESRAVREFFTSCLTNEDASLVIDLTCCEYLDSTFLGCLVSLQKGASRQPVGCFVIAAPAERRESLFGTLRLDRLFQQIDAPPQAIGEPHALDVDDRDARTLGRHVMDCHRALAQVDGPNQAAYASVAETLARELGET
jgi:anti-anti-sigma regulatory factor